jgi:hypothetical protein
MAASHDMAREVLAAFGIDGPRQLSLPGKLKLADCARMSSCTECAFGTWALDFASQDESGLFPPCITRENAATQQSHFGF